MTHPQRVPDYLEHMLVACNRIATTLQGMTSDDFVGQWSAQEIVIRQLLIIGEAAKRTQRDDAGFFDREPVLEPALVIGMRNKLIHEYDTVDPLIVWDTCSSDIPKLSIALTELLSRIRPNFDPDSLHF